MVTILRIVFTAMIIKEIAVPRAVDHNLSEKYSPQIAIDFNVGLSSKAFFDGS
jgi:hypothetical protein